MAIVPLVFVFSNNDSSDYAIADGVISGDVIEFVQQSVRDRLVL